MLATFAIAVPLIIGQNWMESATGKLSKLDNVHQMEEQNQSKYYMLKKFYIDKKHIGVQQKFDVSGKHNEDFNMHLYISLPILASKEDTLNSVCFAWIGKEYFKSIDNKYDESKKEKLFQEFLKDSQYKFDHTDFNQFVYLDRIGNDERADGFKESIKNCLKYNSLHSDIFSTVDEPFENRNGNKFAWICGTFGIGAAVLLLILLGSNFKENAVDKFYTGENQSRAINLKETLTIFIPKENYFITPIIIDINIFIYLLMVFSGLGFISFNASDLLNWGANYKPLTTDGEWWRLLTCTFLHGGLMHLIANMYGLVIVGIFIEPKLGKTKYAIIYLTTGILASVASLLLNDAKVGIGASGAIFGLYGVFIALMLTKVYPKDFSKAFLTGILIFIGYNLIIGFVEAGIDNVAHIGGLVSGFIIGIILYPILKKDSGYFVIEQPNEQQNIESTSEEKNDIA